MPKTADEILLRNIINQQAALIEQQTAFIESLNKKISKIDNKNVVHFSPVGLKAIISLLETSPSAAIVFFYLVRGMGLQNKILIKYQDLQEILGFKRTTIFVALRVLIDHNFINRQKASKAKEFLITIDRSICWRGFGGVENNRDRANCDSVALDDIPCLTPDVSIDNDSSSST